MILGRMTEARDEAEVEDVPGAECSARIVVRWAIQVLLIVSEPLRSRQRNVGYAIGME